MYPTLHSKCHHQTIYPKRNLKIECPPPYTHKTWDCNTSETDLIYRSIESFDWSKLFSSKNFHEQIEVFNITLLKIFHNLITNIIIVCEDRHPP